MKLSPISLKLTWGLAQMLLLIATVLVLSHYCNAPREPIGQPAIALLLQDDEAEPDDPPPAAQAPATPDTRRTPNHESPPTGDEPLPSDTPQTETASQAQDAPWSEVWTADDLAPQFSEVCLDDFDTSKVLPKREDLDQWFDPVDGQKVTFRDSWTPMGVCQQVDGTLHLKMPWRSGIGLRLGLRDFNSLQLHLFDDENGVTLAYYERERNTWAAYTTTRRPRQPRPDSWALTATDETRANRSQIQHRGVVTIWHDNGQIWLTRGDVVLLRAPMPHPPEDFYLDGRATIFGIAATRACDFPPAVDHPIVFDTDCVADLPWTTHLPETSRFVRNEDGSVELTATAAGDAGWAAAPIPKQGLTEVVFEVEEATPGAGVYLGRGEAAPNEAVRFLHELRSGQTVVALRDGESTTHDYGPVRERLVPFASPRQWIRILFSAGSVRWWISGDGQHWAAPEIPWPYRQGGITHLGICHVARKADCRVRLRRVQVRALPEFTSLVDSRLFDKTGNMDAAWLLKPQSLEQWHTNVTASVPDGAQLDDWRWACAARTLAMGDARTVQLQLVQRLLDDARIRGVPAEQQLRLLGEAALLLDIRDDHGRLLDLIQRHHAASREMAEKTGRPEAFSTARSALMNATMLTHYDVPVLDRQSAREEIIRCVAQADWESLWRLCRQLDFFAFSQQVPLTPWAQAVAMRNLPRQAAGGIVQKRAAQWRHPLVEQVSKETYNVLVELQAVLESGDMTEAARQISSLNAEMLQGLSPMVTDRQLLVSLPAAMESLFADYPALAQLLRDEYAEVAGLRVAEATRNHRSSAVELATVQFAGTEAAAQAHQWLGDRALSRGWFVKALSHYRLAASNRNSNIQVETEPRIRLATAMLGRDTGEPVRHDVQFGEFHMSSAEFEEMIRDLLEHRPADATGGDSGNREIDIPPSGFSAKRVGRLDGPSGKDPKSEAIPRCREFKVDWAGRQLAVATDETTAFVSNRFHIAAYRTSDGSRAWQSRPPGGETVRSQDWGLVRMRPLLDGDRIFARLLYDGGPHLVCLNRTDGALMWQADSVADGFVVSDPVIAQGQLLACTLRRLGQSESQLELCAFDASTGRIIHRHDLIRLEDVWWRRRYCQAAQTDDGLIIALGGITLSCDARGNVRWIRRHLVLPPEEEPSWVRQAFEGPLVRGDQLYILQPGMPQVERLELRSGRSTWRITLPDALRLICLTGDCLVLQTAQGLIGLDNQSGEQRWSCPLDGTLEGIACANDRILVSQAKATDAQRPRYGIRLNWLEGATGRVVATTTLGGLEDEDPKFGPLFAASGKIWAFFGRGHEDPNRDLMQLVAEGDAERPSSSKTSFSVWPTAP